MAACIYLMIKYKWSVQKALEYLCSKKGDILINSNILTALLNLQQQMVKERVQDNSLSLESSADQQKRLAFR